MLCAPPHQTGQESSRECERSMLRSVAGKVTWMARATTTVVGLAIMLALVVGVTSTAFGANGDFLKLGTAKNVATKATALVGKVASGSSLVVKNPSGGSALGLQVNAGKAPLTVNADAGKATNLNADKLDGQDSVALLPGGDLPRGRTVRGHYDIRGTIPPSRGAEVGSSAISFGYRLDSTPSTQFIKEGAQSTPQCPGTAHSPEAAPGYLCVYEAHASNLAAVPPDFLFPNRSGASLRLLSAFNNTTAPLEFVTLGTWAVTGN